MKVFGIGLSKTGTHSLTTALRKFGLKSGHWVIPPYHWQENAYGNFKTKLMEEYDAMTDIGVATHFEQLYRVYPNSKFILTVRHSKSGNLDEWLDSCKRAWSLYEDTQKRLGGGRGFYMTACYGCWHFNPHRWEYVYKRHYREVKKLFKNEPDKLLILNIHNSFSTKNYMDILKDFLGMSDYEIKDKEWPFNWTNWRLPSDKYEPSKKKLNVMKKEKEKVQKMKRSKNAK